jgi:exopolysaccharide production protein ExoQ
MQRSSTPMIKSLIFLGCALTFWGNVHGIGPVLQPLFLVFFFVAALIGALRGQIAPIAPTVPELILYATGILSAVVAVCRSLEPCMLYSLAFLTTMVLISVLVRVVQLEEILDIGAAITLLLVLSSVVFDRQNFLKALSVSISRTGLFRFSPFGNHPNLTGLIFGAGSILLAQRAIVARSVTERIIMLSASVLAWVCILAASARASLAALLFAALAAVIKELRLTKATVLTAFGAVALAIASMVTTVGGSAIGYIQRILDVSSRTRGIGSGASGRTDSWRQAADTLISDPLLLMFGGSLRSSDSSIIGFDATEDAYLTILLDSGLFAGAAIIGIFLYSPIEAISLSRASENDRRRLILLPSFFVFLLIEGIFNRYLLGIGNPMSLIVLMIVVSLAVRARIASNQTLKSRGGVTGIQASVNSTSQL